MKAITLPQPGGPEALVLDDVPDPMPRPGEVVVEVVAAGVNRADVMQRQGHYDPPPGSSAYPGLEVSGRIAQLGDGVDGWSVGDEVCALLTGGGYAEKVTVPAGQLLPVPAGVSLEDAAALPEVACTVWSNIFMTANIQPGEVLLVHGGGSGIGTMAVQLGREVGARVAVTAGSPEKLEVCRELGASILVNYRSRGLRGGRPRGHRRARRGRHPRHHRGEVPRPQRRAAGGQRPARRHRAAGWAHRRDRPRGDARQALRARRDDPPGEAGGGEGGDRRSGP